MKLNDAGQRIADLECEVERLRATVKGIANDELLLLYSVWSEEFYCAGFMVPSSDTVEQFRNWLDVRGGANRDVEDYEQEMLDEYHRQQALAADAKEGEA